MKLHYIIIIFFHKYTTSSFQQLNIEKLTTEEEEEGRRRKKMGFLELLMVAFMPPLQVLLIAILGAFLATDYCGFFKAEVRRNLNKLVFYVFTPSLIFGSLAETMTLQDIISWWFMPVNIGIIFFFGSLLGWIVVKIMKPEKHLEGLIIATCSAGNLGNLMIIIVPAVCNEEGSPFGNPSICRPLGLSYASFSMALGGFYIWTHTYSLMRNAGAVLHQNPVEYAIEEGNSKMRNMNSDSDGTTLLLKNETESSPKREISASDIIRRRIDTMIQLCSKFKDVVHQIIKELLQPPSFAAMVGLVVGAVPWLKSLIIGDSAPFAVIEDSINLLGNGTIPSVTLILGGNLLKGMRKSNIRNPVIIGVITVRFILLPLIGITVVSGASYLNLLPQDPLFKYVLMTQFTLPPAMNIGTMAELFNVGQEECSVLFLWTYLVAAVALTLWSTVYMWILA